MGFKDRLLRAWKHRIRGRRQRREVDLLNLTLYIKEIFGNTIK